jgi:hypothetical protein
MSARSRALRALADHFDYLADKSKSWATQPIYNATDMWERAADMSRRTAEENTWPERALRRLRLFRLRRYR